MRFPGTIPSVLVLTVGGLLLAAGVDVARGQCQANELAKLTALDAALWDEFGVSVSISGDVAVIGARHDDEACPGDPSCNSGSAYVYRLDGSTWIQETKLTASDAAADDRFGRSVCIGGDVIVIAACRDDDGGTDSGSAYAYRYSGGVWIQEEKLTASDAAADDRFGRSVSISGDALVIGAPKKDHLGKVYVYRYNGGAWSEEGQLTASDAAPHDRFGWSASISGDWVVVGAWADDDAGSASGSAYMYRFDGANWIEQAKLAASDAALGDQFGYSVAIDGDLVVVGAHLDDDGGSGSGSAYVFEKPAGGWTDMTETAKLTASDAAAGDELGVSVSLSGDVVVIGAAAPSGSGPGAAYVFDKPAGGWTDMTEAARLTASDAAAGDEFGGSVCVSGDAAVSGAQYHASGGYADAGAAYVFGGLSDCQPNGTLDVCDIADGTSDDADGDGLPDECEALVGDLNCDGHVDGFDIDPFILALLSTPPDHAEYYAEYPDCDVMLADIDGSGHVDGFDIDPFVELLTGG